ncbi:MAG: hypothetical protein U0172_03265 [Nitrospiraceae bacterium]
MLCIVAVGSTSCRSSAPSIPLAPLEPVLPPGLSVEPVVNRLSRQVIPLLETNVGAQQKTTQVALSGARTFPAVGKRPDVVDALLDPWDGLNHLEAFGLLIAALSKHGTEGLDDLLLTMERYRVKSGHSATSLPPWRDADEATNDTKPSKPKEAAGKDVAKSTNGKEAVEKDSRAVETLTIVMEEIAKLCAKSVAKLSTEDRQFLFEHPLKLIDDYRPQTTDPHSQTKFLLYSNRRYVQLIEEFVQYDALLRAAQLATKLADLDFLRAVTNSLRDTPRPKKPIDGIKGDLLYAKETSAGWIVIGGAGSNTYQLDGRIALLIDVGGDDTYRGAIAATTLPEKRAQIVIDLAGNDTYQATESFGLATGRLGIGVLIDKRGNDNYDLSDGSGGTGFAGIGLLYDEGGNDLYNGARFTQGAAIGGLGLLLDADGNDQYHSSAYAIGFGGPAGIGAVVDLVGGDTYQCGGKLPSLYNDIDAPDNDPNNPLYQYDCFGLGVGAGARVVSKNQDDLGYALAGGMGMLLDLQGNDHYQSGNFSQGTGYFFGAGLKLDLHGNDDHLGARNGIASAAHYGVGLFLDYHGADYYDSTGPHSNGASGWDASVMLGVDADQADDTYGFERSDGLGIADDQAWAVFIDEGGRDRYQIPKGLAVAENGSIGAFFDLSGQDFYGRTYPNGSGRRADGQTIVDSPGALFVDK